MFGTSAVFFIYIEYRNKKNKSFCMEMILVLICLGNLIQKLIGKFCFYWGKFKKYQLSLNIVMYFKEFKSNVYVSIMFVCSGHERGTSTLWQIGFSHMQTTFPKLHMPPCRFRQINAYMWSYEDISWWMQTVFHWWLSFVQKCSIPKWSQSDIFEYPDMSDLNETIFVLERESIRVTNAIDMLDNSKSLWTKEIDLLTKIFNEEHHDKTDCICIPIQTYYKF